MGWGKFIGTAGLFGAYFEREIPDRFVYDYCVAKYCESAQLILEVI